MIKHLLFNLAVKKRMLIFFLTGFSLSLGSVVHAQHITDYYVLAATNNPGLQAKYKNFEAALQKVTQMSSLPDPNLSFGYFISPVETRVGPQRAKISLTQMIPWFGTLKAQENSVNFLAEAKYQEFLDARNKLYFEISAAYFPLIELNRVLTIEKENLSILNSYKHITTGKFQNGKGSMIDVLRVELMITDASTNISILEKKKIPLETRFNKLLNRPAEEVIAVDESMILKKMPSLSLRDSLLNNNPLLEGIDLKIKASEASELAANKQGLPKFGVGLDYVLVDERTDMAVTDNGKDVFMPMVTMSLPIFRGKYKAARQEASLMKGSYSLQKVEMENMLMSSFEMVWFKIQAQFELIELYEQQIKISQQSLNLLYVGYSNSGKEFEEVLRMQQQLLKYQKMTVTATTEYHVAIAELDYITANSK